MRRIYAHSYSRNFSQSNVMPVPGSFGATARWFYTTKGRVVYSSIGKL
jgi:hypothetical protein